MTFNNIKNQIKDTVLKAEINWMKTFKIHKIIYFKMKTNQFQIKDQSNHKFYFHRWTHQAQKHLLILSLINI